MKLFSKIKDYIRSIITIDEEKYLLNIDNTKYTLHGKDYMEINYCVYFYPNRINRFKLKVEGYEMLSGISKKNSESYTYSLTLIQKLQKYSNETIIKEYGLQRNNISVKDMTLSELTERLEESIGNEDFEKSAEIRDEIDRRNG